MPARPLAATCSSLQGPLRLLGLQGVPAWCPDVGMWYPWGLHPEAVRTLH